MPNFTMEDICRKNRPHYTVKIVRQMCGQGSYGINKINPRTGVRIGHVINVWHIKAGDRLLGTYPTRAAARTAWAKMIEDARQDLEYNR